MNTLERTSGLAAMVALCAGGVAFASPIAISNAGFEDNEFAPTGFSREIVAWTTVGDAGAFRPNQTMFTNAAPEGLNVAFVQVGWTLGTGALEQTLDIGLQANTTYTLSGLVGRRLDNPIAWTGYTVSLWAGDERLAIVDTPVAPAMGAFESFSLNFTSAEQSVFEGELLKVRLEAKNGQTAFDAITLDATPIPAAGPAALAALAMLSAAGRSRRSSPRA
ncbi:MAG: hypothetical protein SFZ23_13450 [Planctomycetota bacterium]|nr:hypothetical protein [Planctomycetota bacterium]